MSASPPLLAVPDHPDAAYTVDELFEHAPCGYLTLSADGTVLAVNETLLGWSGRPREQVVGSPVLRLLTLASRLAWETQVAPQIALTGAVRAVAVELAGPQPRTGRPVLLSADTRTLTPAGPPVVRVVAFDATERARYEQELRAARRQAERTEARLRTLHRVVADLSAATDHETLARGVVAALTESTSASAATVWFTGTGPSAAPQDDDLRRAAGSRAPDDLAPTTVPLTSATLPALAARVRDVVAVESPEDARRTHPELASALADCRMQAALSVPLVLDGTVLGCYSVCFVRARTFSDDERELHRTIARHVTEALRRVRSHQELGHLALHDALTGLPNRSLFTDRLDHALVLAARARASVTVMLLDLDGFKQINDGLGHDAGDQVLVEVGRRAAASLRGSDTLARLGGDEFTVLCSGLTRAESESVAARLEAAVREPVLVDEQEVFVTASLGLVVHEPAPGDPAATSAMLLRDADAAMYRAKTRGKDRHTVFDAALRAEAAHRRAADEAIVAALEDDRVVVHYQPVHDLRSGRATGVEALCRLVDAEGELMMPGQFIPLAEERGHIVLLGLRVLEKACAQLAAWTLDGLDDIEMAVNVAARQAERPDLAELVKHTLVQTGCPPDRLVLELTESTLLQGSATLLRNLQALRDLGVGIALDDFGTRYASLHYVQQFPITELKIDRAFVSGLPDGRTEGAIVEAVAGLAAALDLVCVAEGIETVEQLEHLARLGVRGQGYVLGRPGPAEECEALLRRSRRA